MPPAAPHRTPFGRALANVGWLLTGKGVGALLSLVYLALATRTLGVAGFGQFSLILGTAQAASALVAFQTWQLVVRFGMVHLTRADRPALTRLVRWCMALDLLAALVGCALAAGAILAMRTRFGWSATLTGEAIGFSVVLLLSIRSTAVGVLRLHDRFAAGAAADAVTPIARFAGALAAVATGAGVPGFLFAWGLAEVLTAAGYWIVAVRLVPLGGHRSGGPAPARENPGLWRFAWQTNLNGTLGAAGRQFAVVIVGLATGAAAAGGYRLAHQLAQALVRVAEMFARGVFPEVTRAHAGESGAELTTLASRSLRLASWVGVATCIAVPALGRPALALIAGPAYLSAYPLLLLLGVAAGLDIVAVGYEPVLLGTGHAGAVLRIRVASVVVLFAAMAPLLAWAGATGAGVAVLLSSAAGLAMLARATRRVRG